MNQNYRRFLLMLGIAVIFYTFITLQFLVGLIAVGIILLALIATPPDE